MSGEFEMVDNRSLREDRDLPEPMNRPRVRRTSSRLYIISDTDPEGALEIVSVSLLSQNCVCKSCPPGALKQHRSATAVVFWQLSWGFEHVRGVPTATAPCVKRRDAAAAAREREYGRADMVRRDEDGTSNAEMAMDNRRKDT